LAPFQGRRGLSSTEHKFFHTLFPSHRLLPLKPLQSVFATSLGACFSPTYHIQPFLLFTPQYHPKSTTLPLQAPGECLQSCSAHLMDPDSPVLLPPPSCIPCLHQAPVSPSQLFQSLLKTIPVCCPASLGHVPTCFLFQEPYTFFFYSFQGLLFYFSSSLLLPVLFVQSLLHLRLMQRMPRMLQAVI